ncbi:MAG: hypothetical protein U0869_20120 [Chloroflexota bacterium]
MDRASVRAAWVPIAAVVGDDIRAGLDEIESGLAGVTDPQSLAERALALGWVGLIEGRPAEARAAWRRSATAQAGPNFAGGFGLAARGALWAGDADGVRVSLAELDTVAAHGPALEADRAWMGAAVAAAAGRRAEAVAGFRLARTAFADLGIRLDLGLAGIDVLAALGPDDPDAQEMAAESRRILVDLGALPFIAELDRRLAGAAAPTEETGVSG